MLRSLPFLKFQSALLGLSLWIGQAFAAETMVVTGTREEKEKNKVPESVDVLTSKEIEDVSPSHPAEILNRVPGVHVNNLSGEGHMTSIRQPISTSGVYLYLEDGVPTRPSGFFNHNGLYEVDIPQADRIEVIKGPSSALYGSEAIGGTIHSLTKASPAAAEVNGDLEIGSYGWRRLLLTVGGPFSENHGFRIDTNLTESEGYRDESEYSRGSAVIRFDGRLGEGARYRTVATFTNVDQSGVSDLAGSDYRDHPTKNLYHGDIAFREVEALRLSSEVAVDLSAHSLLTVTPFYRNNTMEIMPSWMVTYDPNVYTTRFQSLGLLAKLRTRFPEQNVELIGGFDFDHTPSSYEEDQITVTRQEDIFTDYSKTGRRSYDYSATQNSISPYIHAEWQAFDPLRLSAGLRYDHFEVDYEDELDAAVPETVGARSWLRPDDTVLKFDHLSPKLGVVYRLAAEQHLYANYRHAFRVPSVGQLFRSGTSTNTAELKPVVADSSEVGYRSRLLGTADLDISVYQMLVKDDVVNVIDGNDRKVTNAGETEHRGIEIGLQRAATSGFGFRTAWTFSEQTYKDFQYIYSCFPPRCTPAVNETRNFAGSDVGRAPKTLGNFSVHYVPEEWTAWKFEAEWEHVGRYYTDETNTQKYGGHDLFNLRGSYAFLNGMQVYGRILNVADRLYSTYTSNQVGSTDITYRPGLPRTYFVGLRAPLL